MIEDTRQLEVRIAAGDAQLAGEVWLPAGAPGIVLFAHGSGSSRLNLGDDRMVA